MIEIILLVALLTIVIILGVVLGMIILMVCGALILSIGLFFWFIILALIGKMYD